MQVKPKKSLPSNEPVKPALPAVRPTAEAARFMQTEAVPASLYRHLLAGIVGKDEKVLATVTPFVQDLVQRFEPCDPVEEMLIVQMMLSHLHRPPVPLRLRSAERQVGVDDARGGRARRQHLPPPDARPGRVPPPAPEPELHGDRPSQHRRPAGGRKSGNLETEESGERTRITP